MSRGNELIYNLRSLEHMISTLVCFPKSPLSDTMLEAAGQHIPENIYINLSINNTTMKPNENKY
jgi:hypothetical protein